MYNNNNSKSIEPPSAHLLSLLSIGLYLCGTSGLSIVMPYIASNSCLCVFRINKTLN